MKQLPHLCQSTGLIVSSLFLLPWCEVIAGYRISSNNTNSQQQLTICYSQTSKLLSGASLPTRVKPLQTGYMHNNSSTC